MEAIRRKAAEVLYGGSASACSGRSRNTPALAAWGCTLSGPHPARRVPDAVREVVHLQRYRLANRGRSRMEVWSSRAESEGGRAAADERAWQVAELRSTVGNPFRREGDDGLAEVASPDRQTSRINRLRRDDIQLRGKTTPHPFFLHQDWLANSLRRHPALGQAAEDAWTCGRTPT